MPSFPVDLMTYLADMRVQQQVFDLGEGVKAQSRTAGGQIIRSGGVERLWHGAVSLAPRYNDQGRALQARLHVLRAAGASFYVGDTGHNGGTFAAALAGVQANGTVNISGGPASQTFAAGDYISFDYNGIRALHQIADSPNGWALTSTGVRNGIEVVPPVRPGWTAGTAVTIGATKCRAVIVPGSVRVGQSVPLIHEGASFEWVQLLRSAA